jgi:cell division septation protein DedD/nucleoid DNA-binding protein
MDKYLHEILLAHLSVILPELGALSMDETSKMVVFNPFIKYNDEKFENFLVEKHNKDKQTATNMVAQYVQQIQNQLNKGEDFSIFNFGRFVKNAGGEIEFQNWSEFNKVTPAKKTSPTETEAPKKENNTKNEDNKKPIQKNPVAEMPKKTLTDTSKEEKTIPTLPKEKPTKPTKPVKEKVVKQPQEKKARKKRSLFFYINIAILLLLICSGIYIYFNFSKVQKLLGIEPKASKLIQPNEYFNDSLNKNPTTDTIQEVENPSAIDSSVISIPSNEVPEESTTKIAETTPKEAKKTKSSSENYTTGEAYHIIGGGFQAPENAERFAESLKNKGFEAHVVGVFNGLSLVAIQSYPTQEEAKAALSDIAGKSGVRKPWIFKH